MRGGSELSRDSGTLRDDEHRRPATCRGGSRRTHDSSRWSFVGRTSEKGIGHPGCGQAISARPRRANQSGGKTGCGRSMGQQVTIPKSLRLPEAASSSGVAGIRSRPCVSFRYRIWNGNPESRQWPHPRRSYVSHARTRWRVWNSGWAFLGCASDPYSGVPRHGWGALLRVCFPLRGNYRVPIVVADLAKTKTIPLW
jgi:hypothetical protein